jgi:predicted subunit of tRNA(5-methylaminomethyl-2-thiouridylate) methyltransferase
MKKARALVLLSGGLDSILAVRTLQEQGIKVVGLSFKSCFFDDKTAQKAAKGLKIPLKVVDFSKEQLAVVKHPRHGYGQAMNPCIDCHALMFKKAKEIMKKDKFDFVATGEVLGERPMSQNLNSLKLIEKESGLTGYLLRPLSAKLLEPTVPEKNGLVDRNKLFDIAGRSRKPQMALAKKWGIREYPAPAGGCLLTELVLGQRLKELLEIHPKCEADDINILKYGRHTWFGKAKIVVGRDNEENQIIKRISRKGDIVFEMKDYPGPVTLVRNYSGKPISPEIIKKAQELTMYYSAKTRDLTEMVRFTTIKHT